MRKVWVSSITLVSFLISQIGLSLPYPSTEVQIDPSTPTSVYSGYPDAVVNPQQANSIELGNTDQTEVQAPASHKDALYPLASAAVILTGGLIAGAVMWGVCDDDDSSTCNRVENAGIAMVATCSTLIVGGTAAVLGYQCYKTSKR